MIKSFRIAALAAVTAFLCPVAANAANAAAEREPASILTESAAAPVIFADRGVPSFTIDAVAPARTSLSTVLPIAPAPAVTGAPMSATFSSLFRIRPDRVGVTTTTNLIPLTTPLRGGVNAQAGAPVRPLADLVAAHMSSATGSDEQFDCLARTVYFESRGEPIEGQLAVAEVVLNRVRSGMFRSTVCDVVKQRAQFSFVRAGVIPEVPRGSVAWQRSVAIARIAVDKLASINGEQSLFFHADYVHPNFGRPRIGQIGRHIFFR